MPDEGQDLEDAPVVDAAPDADPACRPTSAPVDLCDGIDDDCDGEDGEDDTPPADPLMNCHLTEESGGRGELLDAAKHHGRCIANARWACDAGAWTCRGAVAPEVEQCDGVDGDCDGVDDLLDEDLVGRPCDMDGRRDCRAEWVCEQSDGVFVSSCRLPRERCDGVDNDCDGRLDEGREGRPLVQKCSSDVGECTIGEQACQDGQWAACSGAGPRAEKCDDLDNDCDGIVDEDVAREPCDTGTPGICGAGTRLCEEGALRCRADMEALDAELCNDLDDDCDGTVDEGFDLGASCQTGIGECTREGVFVCAEGARICSARPGMPEAERCDGLDDEDCDGVIDEGFHSGAPCLGLVMEGQAGWAVLGSCGCGETGRAVCIDQQNITRTAFFVDRNNGLDDDCDGDADEVPPPLPGEAEQ